MASNAIASSSSEATEVRPQAGPLPQKRGEIGFREGLHVEVERPRDENVAPLPPRHPADRGGTPPPPSDHHADLPPSEAAPRLSSDSASTVSSSLQKASHSGQVLSWTTLRLYLRRKKLGGIRLSTVLRFIVQILLLSGTIGAWVILAVKISHTSSSASVSGTDSNPNTQSSTTFSTASIFVHITFALTTLAQIIFLERCIFYLRAQRYAYLHPGQVLPRHGRNVSDTSLPGGDTTMAFAPWNRPPLPTYAAALAQSGVGTGDVEDHLIAVPPPPAYGNTRGSTLLLANLIRASSRRSTRTASRADQSNDSERPRSRQMDGDWELVDREEAERALKLADSLERLEAGRRDAPRSQQR